MTERLCPACQRPLALARPTCLYCGARLPEALVASARAAREALLEGPQADPAAAVETADDDRAVEAAATTGARVVVVLDLAQADQHGLARALGLSLYDAGQRCRRPGPQLLRVGAPPTAAEDAALRAAGVRWRSLPEGEVRAASQPLQALGGSWRQERLHLRLLRAEPVEIGPGELVLGVRGTLQRERVADTRGTRGDDASARWPLGRKAPGGGWRRGRVVPTPGLEPGHRVHLHRRADTRPIELDPAEFEFGDTPLVEGAPWLALLSWTGTLLAGAALDDGFKQLAPVLAPSNPETGTASVRAVLEPNSASTPSKARASAYDNLEQFRFYSAWRGLFER